MSRLYFVPSGTLALALATALPFNPVSAANGDSPPGPRGGPGTNCDNTGGWCGGPGPWAYR